MNNTQFFTAAFALLTTATALAVPTPQTSPFILNGSTTPNNTVVFASGGNDVVTTASGTFNPSSAFSDSGGNTSVTIGAGTAFTVTSGNQAISLQSGSVDNFGQVTTTTSNTAIVLLATPSTVTNESGAVLSGGQDGIAIQAGGTVTNSGSITGTNTDGVFALSGSATVTNNAAGTIQGGDNGLDLEQGGTVTNAGSVTGNNTGVLFLHATGTVTNSSGGTISGNSNGISLTHGGTVTNSGTVTSAGGVGILSLANGTITNNAGGTITGPNDGIDLNNGGTVVNSGTITSSGNLGVFVTASTGSVTNNAGGMISGSQAGVDLNEGGTLYNAGQVTSSNLFGVRIGGAGGTITNAVGGTITGPNDAIEVNSNNDTTVNNYGTVASTDRFGIFGGAGNTINNFGTISTTEGTNGANPNYNAVFLNGTFTNVGGTIIAPALNYAVQFTGSNNTANIGSFSRFVGNTSSDLFGGGNANEVLNFIFFGGTVTTQTGTPANGSLTAQGVTYTYQAFTAVNVNSTSIASLGTTSNEVAIGQGLDNAINVAGLGNISPAGLVTIDAALANLFAANPAAVGGALSEVSPEKFAAFSSATAFNNATFETQGTDEYLDNRRLGPQGTFIGGNGHFDTSGLAINDPNYDPQLAAVHSRLLAWNPAPNSGLISDIADPMFAGVDMKDSKDMKAIAPVNDDPWNFFVRGNVILAQGFSQADVPHFDDNTESVTLGADYRFTPNFLFGLSAAYAHTDATLDTNGSSATVDSYSPGLYASYADHGWYANFSGNYLHNAYTQSRVIAFLGQTANSAPEGNEGVVNLDGGYEFHQGALTYGPLAGLQYTHLSVDGFNESGSVADLSVNEDDSDSLRSRLGGRASYLFTWGGVNITPHLDASWQHEFLDQDRGVTSQFTGFGGGSFSVRTPSPSRDSALIDAGVNAEVDRDVTVFVDYVTQAGSDNYFGQSVQAGVKIGF